MLQTIIVARRKCGKLKSVWLGTQISLERNRRLMKVVLYFPQASKGSRLFKNTARISRICESVTSICMVVDFHGCQVCVCKRASMFHSNQDLTGWQVVALYRLNVNLRSEPTEVLTFDSGWINTIRGARQPFLDHECFTALMRKNSGLKLLWISFLYLFL